MLISAPRPTGVDLPTEMRLNLRQKKAICEQLRVNRDAAEESCRRNRQARVAQHSKISEEEMCAADELRKTLHTLKLGLERVKEKVKEEKNVTAYCFAETHADDLSQNLNVKRAENAVQRGYALLASLL